MVAIALSGSVLVWHDQFDALMHPGRYAIGEGSRPPSHYLAAAADAVGPRFQPVVVRFPLSGPVTVLLRE